MALTAAQVDQLYRNAGFKAPADLIRGKASKMRNVKKEVFGITFDSSLEAKAYQVLRLWQMSGAIRNLVLQPPFELQEGFRDADGKKIRNIKYLADFQFFDVEKKKVRYVDVKGHKTAVFRLKEKLFKFRFPDADLELWTKDTIKSLARR